MPYRIQKLFNETDVISPDRKNEIAECKAKYKDFDIYKEAMNEKTGAYFLFLIQSGENVKSAYEQIHRTIEE